MNIYIFIYIYIYENTKTRKADEDGQFELERMVECLDSWHYALSDAARDAGGSKLSSKRYSPELILRTVFAVMTLKQKTTLQSTILQRIVPLMPSGLQSLAQELRYKLL